MRSYREQKGAHQAVFPEAIDADHAKRRRRLRPSALSLRDSTRPKTPKVKPIFGRSLSADEYKKLGNWSVGTFQRFIKGYPTPF